MNRSINSILGVFLSLMLSTSVVAVHSASPPRLGDKAQNFTLQTLDGVPVQLHHLTATNKVVLVVLRGWPGYQCPLCTRQVGDLVQHASALKQWNIRMVFVYPGPSDGLEAHAREFLQDKSWPQEFLFVTDPDYSFTKAYGLRWDAPKETAYPSVFIIDQANMVRYAHISRQHGDRVSAEELLKKLAGI